MQEEAVVTAHFVADLSGRFEERLGFDVTDRATDLGDHDIGRVALGVGCGHRQDATLDLIRDVRDHLDGVAEVFAAPFLRDDGRVHLAGGDVRVGIEVAVEEALVVPHVEVGLGAVLCDEHLTVLERIHGAGIDVEIRVELLHGHAHAACGEQCAETRRGESFAQRGCDAPTDEDVFGRGTRLA